jgi:hypothetical protein
MNATSSENTIAAEAPIGMGRMYGPISPADERHRQNRADDRQRGKDGGIAHLVDGQHAAERQRFTVARTRHPRVTHDVLHHHDGIVDEDANREDEREQRDTVECVAVQVEDEERQREGHGNGRHDDRRSRRPSTSQMSAATETMASSMCQRSSFDLSRAVSP